MFDSTARDSQHVIRDTIRRSLPRIHWTRGDRQVLYRVDAHIGCDWVFLVDFILECFPVVVPECMMLERIEGAGMREAGYIMCFTGSGSIS